MKIFLLDINKEMTDAWHRYFDNIYSVEIVNDDFSSFMDKHPNMEAIVSPANSFGLMDGGYDAAITDYFGADLMKNVQKFVMVKWHGEQPVGTSMTVPIIGRSVPDNKYGSKYAILIHTPTMRIPERIIDYRIVYQCMRTTLIEAINQDVESIVIPAFGASTGEVPYDVVAKMMYLAYKQITNSPSKISWGYAMSIASVLNEDDTWTD